MYVFELQVGMYCFAYLIQCNVIHLSMNVLLYVWAMTGSVLICSKVKMFGEMFRKYFLVK